MKSAHKSLREMIPIIAILSLLGLACVVESEGEPGDGDGDGTTHYGDGDGGGGGIGDGGDGDGGGGGGELPDPSSCIDLSGSDVNGGATLDGCYNVSTILTIDDGHLTIAAGTTIYFDDDRGLRVSDDGSISAEGTTNEPVHLLGLESEKGFWRGIEIRTGSSDNQLDHLVLEHAGSSPWRTSVTYAQGGIYFRDSGQSTITNSEFRHIEGGAIVAGGGGNPLVSSTHFESNDTPFKMRASKMSGLDSNLTFSNNENEVIYVYGGDLAGDVTWQGLEIPYEIQTVIEIGSGDSLTIDAGASFLFGTDRGLRIRDDASLTITGTDQQPVHMAGVQAERGYWRGIVYRDTLSEDNRIENLILEHAGNSRWSGSQANTQGGVVLRGSNTRVEVIDSEFRENRYGGITVFNSGAELNVSGSLFEDNEYPLQLRSNHVAGITSDNAFPNNDGNVVLVSGSGGVSRDATWNALEIPIERTGNFTVSADLIISPGTTILFQHNAGITIQEGTLNAIGTNSDPIVFEGVEDLQGFWRGLYFRDTETTDNQLAHVEIHDAGGEQWNRWETTQASVVARNARVEINDALITNSGGHALGAVDDGTIAGCANMTYENIAHADDSASHSDSSAC